jgi:predicted O-methyltransferase YrrM
MVDTAKAYHRYRAIRDGVVRDDPLYRAAIAASGGRSLVLPQKLECLFLFIRDELKTLDTQDIVEFGSFKGGSALFMAHLLRELYPQARLYACDTYEGMPETSPAHDLHRAGDFAACDLPGFVARRDELGLTNLDIVKGRIEDTFVTLASPKFGLAHIDVDIYSAVSFGQKAAWERMTDGGLIVYDDAEYPTCLGATHAAVEFMTERKLLPDQVWPQWVIRKR